MTKIISIQQKKEKIKKKFSKIPLLYVNDNYLGIVRLKGRSKLHIHDRDEVVYVLDGRLIINVNGTEHILEPGDAILIEKGERHISMNEVETHILIFEPQNIKTYFLE